MRWDWPLLDAWLDCGLFQIQTGIWRVAWNMDCRDYVILEFRVLRKWGLRFRLYDTGMRMMQRKSMKDATDGKLPLVSRLHGDANE